MHSLSVERRLDSPRLRVKQRARLYYTHIWPPAGLSFWVFRIEASYMLPFIVGSISAEAERSSSMETPNCQLFRDTVNSEVPSRPSKARQPRYNSSHDPKLPLLVTATNGVFRVRACLCVRLASYYWIPTAVATTKNMVSRKNGQFKLFSFLFLVAVLYHCVSIGRCCCSLGTTEAVPNRLVW